MYNTSDTRADIRWCIKCRKWFHSCCIKEAEDDLRDAENRGQSYLVSGGNDLFSRIITKPIVRLSRANRAPLSLEILQAHAIDIFKETGVPEGDDWMISSWSVELIEDAVSTIENKKWMICPICISYI